MGMTDKQFNAYNNMLVERLKLIIINNPDLSNCTDLQKLVVDLENELKK
jgi:hypothetical protein